MGFSADVSVIGMVLIGITLLRIMLTSVSSFHWQCLLVVSDGIWLPIQISFGKLYICQWFSCCPRKGRNPAAITALFLQLI